MERFYPARYQDNIGLEEKTDLESCLADKWTGLAGKSATDCVRILLTCTRKWQFFGATLFEVVVGYTPFNYSDIIYHKRRRKNGRFYSKANSVEVPWKIKRTFCDVVLWRIIKFMLKPLGSNSIISLLQAVTRQKITVTDPTISKQVFTGGQAGDIYLPFPAFVDCGRCAGPGRH